MSYRHKLVPPRVPLPGKSTALTIGELDIAVFNVDGQLFALEDACLRCGSSLSRGVVDGLDVACTGCEWHYRLDSGRVLGLDALKIDTFRITRDRNDGATLESPPVNRVHAPRRAGSGAQQRRKARPRGG